MGIGLRSIALCAIFALGETAMASAAPTTIDVAAFGAKCDGAHDDTAALRAAASAVPAAGATLAFPRGVCVIRATIYLKSHTHVVGGATLLAATPWASDHKYGYALMENVHHDATKITDEDFSVRGMTFDYGDLAAVVTPGGGKHALRFEYARNVVVEGNVFLLRGAEDAVAGLGVEHMRVAGNAAYEFRNCAYDFWSEPRDVEVVDNYAETTKSAQMINFNPERAHGDSVGAVASGFRMTGNTLVATGPSAVGNMIEPLSPKNTVRDVTIEGNRLHNAFLVLRGDVRSATVSGNIISDVAGGASAIETYPHWGGTAQGVRFVGNTIIAAETIGSELGVLRGEANDATIENNLIVGGAYRAAPIYQGRFARHEGGNVFTK